MSGHMSENVRLRRRIQAISLAIAAMVLFQGSGSAEETPVHYFTWAGYEIPELHQAYANKHGMPRFSFYGDEVELQQKLRAGYEADIVHPCSGNLGQMIADGLVAPIDVTRVTSWNKLTPALRDDPTLRGPDGEVYLVPFEFGFSTIIYRSDLIKPSEEALSAFLAPEFKQKFSVPNDPTEAIWFGSRIAGVTDLSKLLAEADVAKIKDVWRRILSQTDVSPANSSRFG